MNYEWKQPPTEVKGVRLITPDIIEMLQSRPGEWLFIGRRNRSAWARSASTPFARGVEFTSRNGQGQQADIYLRWIA